ncbi:MAG: TfoX/Sxy family protein [Corallococcus sp.]|nr:TfoX/Sxy family protein [Corallococcus sp.]
MTDKSYLSDLIADLSELGDVTVRPMMGEYLLYVNGRYTACVCDNALFVKSNRQNGELVKDLPQRPPYQGAKPSYVVSGDADFLRKVVYATYLGASEKKKK